MKICYQNRGITSSAYLGKSQETPTFKLIRLRLRLIAPLTPRQAHDAGHEAHAENYLGTEQEHEAIVPVYFLVLPAGLDAPLPHVESAPMKSAANKA